MKSHVTCFVSVVLVAVVCIWVAGCDLFEDDGDWDNAATVQVVNESNCLISLYMDGSKETGMAPDEEFEKTDVNTGIHLLEAYPWNDSQFACEYIYTPYLQKGQIFQWVITNDGGCGDCPPTPTPPPVTPTPSPTEVPA